MLPAQLPNVCHSLSLTLHELTHAAALLHELVEPAQNEADVKLEFFERAKGDDGSAHIQKMIEILKEADGSIGALPKVNGPSCCDHCEMAHHAVTIVLSDCVCHIHPNQ